MHQVHAADALFLVARGVGQRHAALDLARVDAAEGDRADVLEAHDLEGQQRQRIFVDRLAQQRLAVLRVDALERFTIGGRGQEVDDGVEQRLHALVLEGRAAHHRIEGGLDGGLADQPAQRLLVGLLALEVGLHGLVFHVDGGLDHGGAILGGALLEVVGDLLDVHLGVFAVAVPDVGLHGDEVDDAREIVLGADRQLDRNRLGAELLFDVVDAHVEVGAGLIHLVGEDDARHAVLVALAPDRLGLRLDALVASRARTRRRRARAANARPRS